MSVEIVKAEESQAEPLSVMSVIARAAQDPRVDVAKMAALLELQERITAKEAEIAFNRAFAQASKRLPKVVKRGLIDPKGSKIPFAKYEDLDAALRPIEAEFGFTRSFCSQPTPTGVLMVVTLRHDAGHSERSTMQLPSDPGPGRNGLQAIGSARSYGKRYLTFDVWNIITQGEDDDATAVGYITDGQMGTIVDMLAACGIDKDEARRSQFLKFAGAKIVGEIKAADYDRVMVALRAELRKKQGV